MRKLRGVRVPRFSDSLRICWGIQPGSEMAPVFVDMCGYQCRVVLNLTAKGEVIISISSALRRLATSFRRRFGSAIASSDDHLDSSATVDSDLLCQYRRILIFGFFATA